MYQMYKVDLVQVRAIFGLCTKFEIQIKQTTVKYSTNDPAFIDKIHVGAIYNNKPGRRSI